MIAPLREDKRKGGAHHVVNGSGHGGRKGGIGRSQNQRLRRDGGLQLRYQVALLASLQGHVEEPKGNRPDLFHGQLADVTPQPYELRSCSGRLAVQVGRSQVRSLPLLQRAPRAPFGASLGRSGRLRLGGGDGGTARMATKGTFKETAAPGTAQATILPETREHVMWEDEGKYA